MCEKTEKVRQNLAEKKFEKNIIKKLDNKKRSKNTNRLSLRLNFWRNVGSSLDVGCRLNLNQALDFVYKTKI